MTLVDVENQVRSALGMPPVEASSAGTPAAAPSDSMSDTAGLTEEDSDPAKGLFSFFLVFKQFTIFLFLFPQLPQE